MTLSTSGREEKNLLCHETLNEILMKFLAKDFFLLVLTFFIHDANEKFSSFIGRSSSYSAASIHFNPLCPTLSSIALFGCLRIHRRREQKMLVTTNKENKCFRNVI